MEILGTILRNNFIKLNSIQEFLFVSKLWAELITSVLLVTLDVSHVTPEESGS